MYECILFQVQPLRKSQTPHTVSSKRGVCVCVWGGVRSSRHSKRGPESSFYIQSEDIWQGEVKISVLTLWLGALSSLFHNMGVGGMDVILSLYVPGMFRGVWKNALTLNVLYTDLSSLWMPGRTHYKHVYIVCPQLGGCMCIYSLSDWVSIF